MNTLPVFTGSRPWSHMRSAIARREAVKEYSRGRSRRPGAAPPPEDHPFAFAQAGLLRTMPRR